MALAPVAFPQLALAELACGAEARPYRTCGGAVVIGRGVGAGAGAMASAASAEGAVPEHWPCAAVTDAPASFAASPGRSHQPNAKVRQLGRRTASDTRYGAALFDRDGTLVEDVAYNGDPERVRPLPYVREAVALARRYGLRTAVVTNQSGIGQGLITAEQAENVNERVAELLGGFDAFVLCPHTASDGCRCRKPAPGMVLEAARRLGVPPERCVLYGDIGSDMAAARAAGARGVLVATPRTRREEVAAAPERAVDLLSAVRATLAPAADRAGWA